MRKKGHTGRESDTEPATPKKCQKSLGCTLPDKFKRRKEQGPSYFLWKTHDFKRNKSAMTRVLNTFRLKKKESFCLD